MRSLITALAAAALLVTPSPAAAKPQPPKLTVAAARHAAREDALAYTNFALGQADGAYSFSDYYVRGVDRRSRSVVVVRLAADFHSWASGYPIVETTRWRVRVYRTRRFGTHYERITAP